MDTAIAAAPAKPAATKPAVSKDFWERPRVKRGFWKQPEVVAQLKEVLAKKQEAGAVAKKLGVNIADVKWYVHRIEKTGSTAR